MMMTLMIAMTRGRHHRRRHRDSDSETPDARRRRMNENAPRSLSNERVARATLTSPTMSSFFTRRKKERNIRRFESSSTWIPQKDSKYVIKNYNVAVF